MVPQSLHRIRYMLARPLQLHLLPSFVPVIPLPYLKDVPYITVGQVLLLAPWLMLFFAGYHKTFHSPALGGSGDMATYAIIAAFLTANKANSVLSLVFGLSFERIVPIHNLYACLSVILSIFHGYVAYVYGGGSSGDGSGDRDDDEDSGDRRLSGDESEFALYGANTNLWKFLWDGNTNFTGSMCTACLVGLVLLSFFRIIRKYLFEPWLFSHIVFSIGVIAFGVMHEATLLLIPAAWWILDLVLRYGVQACSRFPTSATLTKLSHDLVEIRLRRTFDFEPGQFVQVSVPAVAPLQFHPITISSAPFEKEVTLHIKGVSGWSKSLVDLADKTKDISILLEGPYGNLSMDIANDKAYPVIVCIGGGIGITPCESVARQILHEADFGQRDLAHLRFVWVIRNTEMLDVLPTVATTATTPEDTELGADQEISSDKVTRFQPEVYVTKASDRDLRGRQNTYKGRPNIEQIIQETVAIANSKGSGRVAVVTCGPQRLVDDVKECCRKAGVDVHDEIFDF